MSDESWTVIRKDKGLLKREELARFERDKNATIEAIKKGKAMQELRRVEKEKKDIALANEFYERHPQCIEFIGQAEATERMKRIHQKEADVRDAKIKDFFEPLSDRWYDVIEGSEFDTWEAGHIRCEIEWKEECAEIEREDAYRRFECAEDAKHDLEKAEFEESIVERTKGLSPKDAERLECDIRNKRHEDIMDEYDSYDHGSDYFSFELYQNNQKRFCSRREELLEEYRSLLRQEEEEKQHQSVLCQEKKEEQKMIFDRRFDKGVSLTSFISV